MHGFLHDAFGMLDISNVLEENEISNVDIDLEELNDKAKKKKIQFFKGCEEGIISWLY